MRNPRHQRMRQATLREMVENKKITLDHYQRLAKYGHEKQELPKTEWDDIRSPSPLPVKTVKREELAGPRCLQIQASGVGLEKAPVWDN